MKKFKIPCIFGKEKIPFDLYVGQPSNDFEPLQFQQLWMEQEREGQIPQEVIDSFNKLHAIAVENNVDFEELCMYALGNAAEEKKKEQKNLEEKNTLDNNEEKNT